MARHTRRDFLRSTAGTGVALLASTGVGRPVASRDGLHPDQRPLRVLTPSEAATLGVLGEALLPGCIGAGLVRYIDFQLAGPPEKSMLIAKYVGVKPPYAQFYRQGLGAIHAAAIREHHLALTLLPAPLLRSLIERVAKGNIPHWSAPPAPLFYFVLRSDAVDVTFGTQAGFERLGVPYMAHIAPTTRWGE